VVTLKASQLVKLLNQQGIKPYVEEGKLKTRSTSNQIDSELVKLIREHKDELVTFLSQDVNEAVSPIKQIVSEVEPQPLSFGQRRLWFIDQLEGQSVQYNSTSAIRLEGQLNLAAFNRAFSDIIRRHSVLRARFLEVNGEVKQCISETVYSACSGVGYCCGNWH
jgi:hypothetical protein